MNREKNAEARRRAGVREKMSDSVPYVLKWLVKVELISEKQMTKRLYNSDVEGRRDRGRSCLRW